MTPTPFDKICRRCKKEKDSLAFSVNRRIPDGRNDICRKCMSEQATERYERNQGYAHLRESDPEKYGRMLLANRKHTKKWRDNRSDEKKQADYTVEREHRAERDYKVLPRGVVKQVVERDGPTCYLCQRCLEENEITTDHVIPVSRGGTDDLENLRVACVSCNSSKGTRTADEYVAFCQTVGFQHIPSASGAEVTL